MLDFKRFFSSRGPSVSLKGKHDLRSKQDSLRRECVCILVWNQKIPLYSCKKLEKVDNCRSIPSNSYRQAKESK